MDYALYYLLKWDLNVRVYDAFLFFNLTIFLSVISNTVNALFQDLKRKLFALQFKWILFRLVFGLSLSFTTDFFFHKFEQHV
jgi:hypothetical protein